MPANPDCPDCEGTGWRRVVRDDVPAVERCGCFRVAPAAERRSRAGIPERFERASFSNFSTGEYSQNPLAHAGLTMASGVALRFAEEYPLGEKNGLLLQGPPGTGKTHLAVAAFKKILEKGFDGAFFDYHSLLEKIRSGYDAAAGASDRDAYRRALDAEVLLLDDLGAHRATDWVYDTVTSIINDRYNSNRAVIATTNLPVHRMGDAKSVRNPETGDRRIEEMLEERIGERAVSRLLEMCRVVRLSTSDYRLRGQSAFRR